MIIVREKKEYWPEIIFTPEGDFKEEAMTNQFVYRRKLHIKGLHEGFNPGMKNVNVWRANQSISQSNFWFCPFPPNYFTDIDV